MDQNDPMHSTCLFCLRSLGRNDVLATLPVGNMVAFDAHAGRVWVVCSRCGRWNLLGIVERWGVIEECSSVYSDAALREADGKIGLARVGDSLDLVAIGPQASHSEFALWRYGRRLIRRRRSSRLPAAGAVAGFASAGALVWSTASPAVAVFTVLGALAALTLRSAFRDDRATRDVNRAIEAFCSDVDPSLAQWGGTLIGARLRQDEHPLGWSLELKMRRLGDRNPDATYPERTVTLCGSGAIHALAVILAAHNPMGASDQTVRNALGLIARAGGAMMLLRDAEQIARLRGAGYRPVWSLPRDLRLAVEIAANSEVEQCGIGGDLAELALRWERADAIGAIADSII